MLSLADNLRDYLVRELRTAADHMRSSSEDPGAAVYYYSAAYGAVARVLNVEFSPAICLLHMVLMNAHRELNARVAAQRSGQEAPVALVPALLDAFAGLTDSLARRIEDGADYGDILEQTSVASYVTTGNGYYLLRTRASELAVSFPAEPGSRR